MNIDEFKNTEFYNTYLECWKNPKHAARYAWGLYIVNRQLRESNITGDERVTRLLEAFKTNFQKWCDQSPDNDQIDEGINWWCDATGRLGIGQYIWPQVLLDRLNTDYEGWIEQVNNLKTEGVLPEDIQPEEYAALLLRLNELINFNHFPPGHNVWKSLGCNNQSEYYNEGSVNQMLYLANKDNFKRITRAIAITAKRANDRQGVNDKTEYVSEYPEVKGQSNVEDEIRYISDSDRLSQFIELAGLEPSILTEGDKMRILDILKVLDMGYEFASKQGIALSSYYGEKADSEKTQRQRLFKKIKKTTEKS